MCVVKGFYPKLTRKSIDLDIIDFIDFPLLDTPNTKFEYCFFLPLILKFNQQITAKGFKKMKNKVKVKKQNKERKNKLSYSEFKDMLAGLTDEELNRVSSWLSSRQQNS